MWSSDGWDGSDGGNSGYSKSPSSPSTQSIMVGGINPSAKLSKCCKKYINELLENIVPDDEKAQSEFHTSLLNIPLINSEMFKSAVNTNLKYVAVNPNMARRICSIITTAADALVKRGVTPITRVVMSSEVGDILEKYAPHEADDESDDDAEAEKKDDDRTSDKASDKVSDKASE